jgi:hypothetical protein
MKIEVVVVPVWDVDSAKRFYSQLSWRSDPDTELRDQYRVVQLTPPGSSCAVISEKVLPSRHLVRRRTCTWSYPTSGPCGRSCLHAVSK